MQGFSNHSLLILAFQKKEGRRKGKGRYRDPLDPVGLILQMGMSTDNVHGLVLALSSSVFIGSSFIVKKKGLKKAGATGTRAGSWLTLDIPPLCSAL